jgi:hypothetical protein
MKQVARQRGKERALDRRNEAMDQKTLLIDGIHPFTAFEFFAIES